MSSHCAVFDDVIVEEPARTAGKLHQEVVQVGTDYFQLADLAQTSLYALDLTHPPLDSQEVMRYHVGARTAHANIARVEVLVVLVRVPAGDVLAQAVLQVKRFSDRAGAEEVANQPNRRIHAERMTRRQHLGVRGRAAYDVAHGLDIQYERNFSENVRSGIHRAPDGILVKSRRRGDADHFGLLREGCVEI